MLVGSSGTGEPAPMTVEWDLPPAGLRTTDSTRSPWRLTSCRHRRELATTHSDVSDPVLDFPMDGLMWGRMIVFKSCASGRSAIRRSSENPIRGGTMAPICCYSELQSVTSRWPGQELA